MSTTSSVTNSNGLYDLYDTNMVRKMPSMEDELSSPPGGPAVYPPGSPKPGKDIAKLKIELEQMSQRYWLEKQKNDDLEKANAMRNGEHGEDFKDSQIRQLSRQVTIRQAEVYKKEQRLEEVESEKKAVEAELGLMSIQYEEAMKDNKILRERVKGLEEDKVRMEKAARSKETTRDSLSPPSSSIQSNGSGSLQSLSSNPNYAKELEVLHSMVDSLKQTVIQQRKVFEKIGVQSQLYNSMPQTQIPHPSRPLQHFSSNSIPSTPNLATLSTSPVRLIEPSSEGSQKPHIKPPPSTVVGSTGQRILVTGPVVELPSTGSGNFQQLLSQSGIDQGKGAVSDIVHGTEAMQIRLAGETSPRRNRSEISMSNLVTGMGGISVSGVGSSSSAITSEGRNDGIYINIQNPSAANLVHQRGTADGTTVLLNGSKDSPTTPKTSPRKTSQTEIINRRPQLIDNSSLPVKYRTENLGRNPNLQPNVDMHPLPHETVSYPHDNVIFPPQVAAVTDPRFGHARSPQTWPATQQSRLRTSEPHLIGGIVAATPYVPTTTMSSHYNGVNGTNPPARPNTGQHQDDRLCPVCNQNFSQTSMEDFQTHVFDCFDNENGPETLQPEMASDYTPVLNRNYRMCPMCQDKFDMTMPQSEFEQHVHRHFGEEHFEVIS